MLPIELYAMIWNKVYMSTKIERRQEAMISVHEKEI
jgi:hypothetical protein